MKRKWLRRLIIFLGIFALCSASLWGAWHLWFDPYRGNASYFRSSEGLETVLKSQQAVEDLDYLVRRLEERHPACMGGLPDKLRTEYEEERAKIASSPEVTVLSLWQSAARVLGSLGDAHTAVGVSYENRTRLPLTFVWRDDALICSGGDYDGYTLVKIGGIQVTELYEQFLAQFSYELEAWAQYSFAARLNRSEYLSFLDVDTDAEVSLVLESPDDGKRIDAAIELYEDFPVDGGEIKPNFDYSINQSAGVGIFSLRQCEYGEEYKNTLQAFFTEASEQDIHSIIVDLRDNPGGNSMVANEFVRYLPAESYLIGGSEVRQGPILWKNKPQLQKNKQLAPIFHGKLYVLTGAGTFSSAMDFATLISDNNLGTIVGEIPGNMPSSYGDILCFQTPNAGLVFTVSYKYFVRPDASKCDLPLLPDVQVPAENALDEAMRLIKESL